MVRALPQTRLVLDGEVLALGADGRPEVFQVVASRTMSEVDPAGPAPDNPLRVFFFDLLHTDGQDLLDTPLQDRLTVMRDVVPEALTVPRSVCSTEAEVSERFSAAVADGYEGVVIKNLAAPYAAGRRDAAWVKIKPRHTFDLVVTAAEWGHGRRQGWLSNLHLAAPDPETGELVMLGKTFKGLTDELLTWQTAAVPRARGPPGQLHRLSGAEHGGGDRLRRAADLHPLSGRGRAALRPGAALPAGQDRGRGRHAGDGQGAEPDPAPGRRPGSMSSAARPGR